MSVEHKRGDSFDYSGQVTVDTPSGVIQDFTNWTGECQIRDPRDRVVSDLVFEWVDATTGTLRIYHDGSTDDWNPGPVKIDIQFTSPDGKVVSTKTQAILVVEDITR